ncbi:MAG: hypothetical protein ACP6IY_20545 [Promethearchaeia archaeon]
MKDNIIKDLYRFIIFFQTILLFFFVLDNLDNLSNVEYTLDINGTEFNLNLNVYVVLGVIAGLFMLVIISGLNIFDSGLNDASVSTLSRYVSLVIMFVILTLGTSYYVLQFGTLGLIIQLFILLINLLYMIDKLDGASE